MSRASLGVGRVFDGAAAEYDEARRRLVPEFDGFYGAALEALESSGSLKLVVGERGSGVCGLDLGAGTGLLAGMVAGRWPEAGITLVDSSVEMLEVARRRFAGEPDKFDFRFLDYARQRLPEERDFVVSALSIHHLEDEAKQRVFEEVYRVLKPGGVFVNADQALGETPEVEARYHEAWLSGARDKGASEEELSAALERMREDRSSTLDAQLAWMEEAGFVEVGSRYENGRFVVYSGRKRDA